MEDFVVGKYATKQQAELAKFANCDYGGTLKNQNSIDKM